MFVLSSVEENLRIVPQDLSRPHLDAVKGEIRRLFFDKVINGVGLCITMYDIQSIEGGFVFPSDGAPHFTVKFRLIIFRPFVGEILVGKISKSDETGLYVSLGFFSDIHIPEHLLQEPSSFDKNESVWVWKFGENELFMDIDEEVRFRVAELKYPPLPIEQDADTPPFSPMIIIGDINADGLGLISWWT